MKLLLFLILITLSLKAQTKDVTLVLPWKHQFQFAGYYVAKELGYYEKAGLDVTIKEYDVTVNITEDVTSQKYEFGIGHSFLILDKLNKYKNIVLLNAIYQSSPMVLLSKKRGDIKTLSDIAGKRVMTSTDQIDGAAINAMLFSQNVRPSDYTILEPSFDPIDLVTSKTDFMTSYLSNELFTLEQKGVEYTVFNPKDYGYDFYSDILFTSALMIRDNQKDVDAFRAASLDGWKYTFENIDEAIDIILQKYNTQNKTKKALRFEAETLKKLAFKDGVNFGNIDPHRLNEITTTYRLLGLIDIKSKIDFNTFLYKSANDFVFYKKSLSKMDRDYFEFFNNFYFRVSLFILIILIFISLLFKQHMEKLLKEKTDELYLQNKIFDKNISSSKTDASGKITYVSEAFCNLTGYTESELLSQTHNVLRDESTQTGLYKDLWITISSGHIWNGEFKNRKKDGTEYVVNVVISPVFDKSQNIIAYESIIQDVTLKKVLQEFNEKLESEVKKQTIKLETLAITDKLTGLYNRVKIDDELAINFNYFEKFHENFAVIIFDVDDFKNVNDSHGHQVGDTVLIKISELIKQSVRSTDTVGRWGGEEFMIICPKTDNESAFMLAQNIRKDIETYNFSRVGNLTVSAGVSDILSNEHLDAMISKADFLLYEAKNSGKNMVKI